MAHATPSLKTLNWRLSDGIACLAVILLLGLVQGCAPGALKMAAVQGPATSSGVEKEEVGTPGPEQFAISEHEEGEERKSFDKPGEAQEFYALQRAPLDTKVIPTEQYIEALEHSRRMPQFSSRLSTILPSRAEAPLQAEEILATTSWKSLGPGNIGGRTRSLLIHPRKPEVMYAAGVAGGVWKSTDAGASWAPLSDMIANIAVNSMVMDPKDPNVIYAGTGEGYFNIDAVRGLGIFKTQDGGKTWKHLPSTKTSDFYFVNKLVVSPHDSQTVYAATRKGVWRSRDAGDTWEQTLHIPLGWAGCLDLAMRTDTEKDTLLASCERSEGNFAVFLNPNAAGSGPWKKVLSENAMGRTSLAISPSNQNIQYAMAADYNESSKYFYGLLAVYRSEDGGQSWKAVTRNTDSKKLNTLLLTNPVYAVYEACGMGNADQYYNQGWYDNVLAVDPKNPDIVWAGGIDLFRSNDGGKNWGLASYWYAQKKDRVAPSFNHADHHTIVFHPQYDGVTNKTLFVGNDGGVFRTKDALKATAKGPLAPCNSANSEIVWKSLNNGYGVTQFYHGLPYPGGKQYFGGTQDNGTVHGSNTRGPNEWKMIKGGDGGFVAVHPRNIKVLYAEYTNLSLSKSVDGGSKFTKKVKGITEYSDNFLFITPFVMDPNNPNILWIGGESLWRTKDGAESWDQASAPLQGWPLSAVAAAAGKSNRVLAGTRQGFISRSDKALSTTGQSQWVSKRPAKGYVSSVTFDPHNPNVAYATYSTFGVPHVWKSTDGGRSWKNIDGSGTGRLPNIPVLTLAVDPDDSKRLYIGTDLGVYVSTNGGTSWAVENNGFANVVTSKLVFDVYQGKKQLFAFTHGRGAYKMEF